jgi:hypothetical protein
MTVSLAPLEGIEQPAPAESMFAPLGVATLNEFLGGGVSAHRHTFWAEVVQSQRVVRGLFLVHAMKF